MKTPVQTQPQGTSVSQRLAHPDDVIDLMECARYLWKRKWLIGGATLLGGVIAFAVTLFLMTPKYSSSAMLYVNNGSISVGNTSVSIQNGDLTASRSLVETYLVILESRETLEEVIDAADLPYTYEELGRMITAEAVNETEVFRVTVTTEDPDESARIANAIVNVLPVRIKNIVDGSTAVRVDGAIPLYKPVSPNVTKNVAKGILLGLCLSGGLFVVLFLLDKEIHSETYLLTAYPNIPLLTVVPDVDEAENHKYGYGYGYGYGHRPDTKGTGDDEKKKKVS